jgi:hypothetical protein
MLSTKGNAAMKKLLLFISILMVVVMSCDLSVTVVPTNPAPLATDIMISASETSTSVPASATAILPTAADTQVSVGPLTINLPQGLATGVRGNLFPRAEGSDVAPWGVTPGHTELKLEGYLLQAKTHEPRILIYPAQAYGEMCPAAFENMHRLNNMLGGLQVSSHQLPTVPFFSAQQVFASNIQLVSFQNGRGARFLTEYAQYAVSANNSDLFYQFQGLTDDGANYVIAILPISVPVVAETSDAGAVLPAGGVPYPYFAEGIEADMEEYYRSVSDLLNATSPQSFTPTIDQLDQLIQSMLIVP